MQPLQRMQWALDFHGLTTAEKAVLMVLAYYANSQTGVAWPTVEQLCNGASIGRRTGQRSLRALEEKGAIVMVSRAAQHRAPHYRMVYQEPLDDDAQGRHTGASEPIQGRQPDASEGRHSDTPDSPRGATQSIQGRHTGALTRKEEGSKNKTPYSPPSTPKRTAKRFDEWYATYPKKVGKTEARKKWMQKDMDSQADMVIADVQERMAKDGKWKDDGYIPNPATYLHQERWTDEHQPSRTRNGNGSQPTRLSSMERIALAAERHGMLPSPQPGAPHEPPETRRHAAAGAIEDAPTALEIRPSRRGHPGNRGSHGR